MEFWVERLETVLCDPEVRSGFMPLAREAVAECPDHPLILLMAATAALLDGEPQWALGLLKRFSRLARSPGEHVLRAVALAQIGAREVARALLHRYDLLTWPAILRAFPGGRERLPWLRAAACRGRRLPEAAPRPAPRVPWQAGEPGAAQD